MIEVHENVKEVSCDAFYDFYRKIYFKGECPFFYNTYYWEGETREEGVMEGEMSIYYPKAFSDSWKKFKGEAKPY